MIKIKLNTHLKIAIGYIVLIVVLGFSGWLLYSNMRSQQNVSEASVIFMRRQNAAEQMIYSMLKVSTAERAVCLGQVEEWGSYNEAVDSARKATAGLRSLVSDPRQQERIDSLQLLLTMKYNNVRLVIAELLNDKSDSLYYNKVKNLHSGHDSLVIRPKTAEIKENKQTVYEVIKTKRGFFARLADAFRKQYADTVSVRQEELGQVTDSVGHTINIADTVADVLSEIKLAENKAKQQHKDNVNRKARNLQMVSMQLAQRMQQLLEDVQGGERRYLQRALDKDLVVRKAAFRKVEMLAALSVVCVVILLLFIYRDMRKERIYRNYLVQAKAETEKLMAQRERLLLTITHDIKAPAASISGFIELLSDQVSGEKAKAWLSNIQSSANHLLNLVTALLNYHQLENGKIKPQNVSFRPSQLIESCVAERLPQAMEKSLALECHTQRCGSKMCVADAFRIKQIIDNLVSNALKYTKEGRVVVDASVDGGGWLTVEVADTGVGMTEEECERVFQAFTRLPGAQGIEGVGLGLSIAKENIKMLGGDIQLQSTKGKGSVFTVRVPVAIDSNDSAKYKDAKRDAPSSNITKHIADTDTYKVLIVDDDSLQLQLLKELLANVKSGRWNVIACQHVDEAMRMIKTWHPHILFADIEMPEMGGRELISNIDHSNMVVVAMTAHERSIEPELHSAGFDACLFKPFGAAGLTTLLSQLTNKEIASVRDIAPDSASSSADDNQSQDNASPSNRFAALTVFADGDVEAERTILTDFKTSLDEYISRLTSALNIESEVASAEEDATSLSAQIKEIGSVAHKLLPIASMLNLATLNTIQQLSPEHIAELEPSQANKLAAEVLDELRGVEEELVKMI